MPRGDKKILTVYVAEDDYKVIKATASQAKVSISKFVKMVSRAG